MRTWLDAGVRLIWVLYPSHRLIDVHLPGTDIVTLDDTTSLDGKDVVPGFTAPSRASLDSQAECMQSSPLFRIIWEDEHLFVVEKPTGMVSHPAYRNPDGTLADAVAAWMTAREQPRPWLLHRLDRATSGIVLFAKTASAMRLCAQQFIQHTVTKRYIAVAWSNDLPEGGMIDAALMRDPRDRRRVIVAPEGQAAQTRFAVRERWEQCALVDLWPLTGRTHQLRAHLAYLGHPIIGDPVYAAHLPALPDVTRLLLHAAALTLRVPVAGGTRLRTFLAPMPPDFAAAMANATQPILASSHEAGV